MSLALEVKGLVKYYPRVKAVDDISFAIEDGQIFGLLGPNGAGKTTTLRTILTLSKPAKGQIKVKGIDALKHPEEIRQISGYIPQGLSVDGDLTGYENLLYYAKLYYIPGKERKERIREVLEYMELTDRAKDMARTYSGGMVRRLEIGQSLINRPQILFLDEPSIGLDPAAKRMVWQLVLKLKNEFGTTIFLTTHDMNEADILCDKLAIMNHGKIVVEGSPEALKANLGGNILSIESSSPDCLSYLRQLGQVLESNPSEGSNHSCDLIVTDGEKEIPRVLSFLNGKGIAVESVSLSKPTLDDVFLKYAGVRIDEVGSLKEVYRGRRAFWRS